MPGLGARSIPDLIYAKLREGILRGQLPPGTGLRQAELATRFGVSRVPIREAMNRLQSEGLIVLRPRRGFAVTSLNASEIVEIFELRTVVEEHALRIATLRRTQADVDEVAAIVQKMAALHSGAPDYLVHWADLNRHFHARLIGSANRQRLGEIARNLSDAVEPYIRLESHFTGDFHAAEAEHRQIMDAFARGDADTAADAARAHCVSTMQRLVKRIGNGQRRPSDV